MDQLFNPDSSHVSHPRGLSTERQGFVPRSCEGDDRCPFLTEESLRLSTIPEFLKEWGKVKQEGGLGEVGVRRLQAAVEQFLSRSDVRLVQALFRLTDGMNVWVLARIHIPRTEDGEEDLEGGIVVGGLSSLVVETEPRDSEE